ncbi:MAG: hypothetical protein RL326_796 [Pseudomonadota bacterium]|jgi:hypothetical protein
MSPVVAKTTSVGRGSLDDLQVAKSANSDAQTKTEVSPAIQAAVEKWNEKYSSEPGYRSGSTYAPEQMRETIEVSSALQLPGILAKLHGPDASNIRLTFPQPGQGGVSEGEKTAIRVEQTAIHKFLQNSHGKDLSELLGEVKGLIEKSASFTRDKNNGLLPSEMTADQWIQATVGEKLGKIERYPQKLAVSDVVEIGSKKIETVKASLEVALEEAVESSRGLIITIPDTAKSEANRESLKALLGAFVEARRQAPNFSEDDLAKITVWVGTSKKDITTGPAAGEPCTKVKELPILKFLQDGPAQGRRIEDKGDRTQEEGATISTSPGPKEADVNGPEDPPMDLVLKADVAHTAGLPSRPPEQDWNSQFLVLPSSKLISTFSTVSVDGSNSALPKE